MVPADAGIFWNLKLNGLRYVGILWVGVRFWTYSSRGPLVCYRFVCLWVFGLRQTTTLRAILRLRPIYRPPVGDPFWMAIFIMPTKRVSLEQRMSELAWCFRHLRFRTLTVLRTMFAWHRSPGAHGQSWPSWLELVMSQPTRSVPPSAVCASAAARLLWL